MSGKVIQRKTQVSAVETRLITDRATGVFHFLHTQDCEPIINAVRDAPSIFPRNQKGRMGRYAGSIPLTVAQIWAQEWGVPLYGKEFKKLARKRLDDPDYKYLKVNYK